MYLIYACRLTGWVELGHFPTSTKSTEIINAIREFFHRWGVPQEISVDGASNLTSLEFQNFLHQWSIHHRLSSAYYPQSNGRADAAVKSMKRLIRGHTGSRGSLDTDAIAQGLLQYRNTPLRNAAGKSPAQLALGRELRDMLPLPQHRYAISHHWKDYLKNREHLMSVTNETIVTNWNISAKTLPEIRHGAEVFCQNPKTRKWDRSGKIAECMPYRQYKIKLDDTGRLTLRNRRHIRQRYSGIAVSPNASLDDKSGESTSHSTISTDSGHTTTNTSTNGSTPILRRSQRTRTVPARFGDYDMSSYSALCRSRA